MRREESDDDELNITVYNRRPLPPFLLQASSSLPKVTFPWAQHVQPFSLSLRESRWLPVSAVLNSTPLSLMRLLVKLSGKVSQSHDRHVPSHMTGMCLVT